MFSQKQKSERDAERTRSTILMQAAELFAREGYVGASIADVAEKSGVSKSAIYHYFESKEALLHALVDSLSDDIQTMLDEAESRKTISKKELLRELARILTKHKEVMQVAPMNMQGAPTSIQKRAEEQKTRLQRLLVGNTESKEKIARGVLAALVLTVGVVPSPKMKKVSNLDLDIDVLVQIALDTLGEIPAEG